MNGLTLQKKHSQVKQSIYTNYKDGGYAKRWEVCKISTLMLAYMNLSKVVMLLAILVLDSKKFNFQCWCVTNL